MNEIVVEYGVLDIVDITHYEHFFLHIKTLLNTNNLLCIKAHCEPHLILGSKNTSSFQFHIHIDGINAFVTDM